MKKPLSNSKRVHLRTSLIREMRQFIARAILLNQQFADSLRINATDYQILNLLDLQGSATPGALAQWTGLTTGGVTVVLDRLEKAGYIKRERNPADRRSLLIRTKPKRMRRIYNLYGRIHERVDQICRAYDDDRLATIIDFFIRANGTATNRKSTPSRIRPT